MGSSSEEESAMALVPPRIPLDIPALRVPHPPLAPLKPPTNLSLACRGAPHASPALARLNTHYVVISPPNYWGFQKPNKHLLELDATPGL